MNRDDIELIIHEGKKVQSTFKDGMESKPDTVAIAPASDHPKTIKVKGAPINLLYKGAATPLKVEGKGFFDIDPEMSLLHAQHTAENGLRLHEDTPREVMRIIQPDTGGARWELLAATWAARTSPYDLDHLIGRIDLTLKVIDMGVKRIQWSQPEAGLHPAWACELADFLIRKAGGPWLLDKGADNE